MNILLYVLAKILKVFEVIILLFPSSCKRFLLHIWIIKEKMKKKKKNVSIFPYPKGTHIVSSLCPTSSALFCNHFLCSIQSLKLSLLMEYNIASTRVCSPDNRIKTFHLLTHSMWFQWNCQSQWPPPGYDSRLVNHSILFLRPQKLARKEQVRPASWRKRSF
jgi:hypothetical protein